MSAPPRMEAPAAASPVGAALRRAWPVLAPFALYTLQTAFFRHWIVDDAGIAFSYARSLAQGHGLVSQPGVPPVEGYSDPLWVFLLAPFHALHLFHPSITPKLVSLALVLAAYVCLARVMRTAGAPGWAIAVALGFISISTPFVYWTCSGLENPLYAALTALLAWQMVVTLDRGQLSLGRGLVLGLTTAGLALTRPEGVVFAAAWPLAAVHRGRRALGSLLGFAAAFGVVFGGYLLFRLAYFHDFFPNTYYAKGAAFFGQTFQVMEQAPLPARAVELLFAVGGPIGFVAPLWLALLLLRRVRSDRVGPVAVVLGVLLVTAAAAYLLLPPDWMEEGRFATPFLLLLWPAAVLAAVRTLRSRSTLAITLGVAAGLSVLLFGARTALRVAMPTVPFADVAVAARRYNHYAELLDVPHPSVLAPDVGGEMYYSRLRVYDLGMLCDRTIARTLERDPRAFRNYVFDEVKPTFIHVHGVWRQLAQLDADPRLARDYEELWPGGTEWLDMQEYVRRDALAGRTDVLERMRRRGWDSFRR